MNFENRLRFDKVTAMSLVVHFFGTQCRGHLVECIPPLHSGVGEEPTPQFCVVSFLCIIILRYGRGTSAMRCRPLDDFPKVFRSIDYCRLSVSPYPNHNPNPNLPKFNHPLFPNPKFSTRNFLSCRANGQIGLNA